MVHIIDPDMLEQANRAEFVRMHGEEGATELFPRRQAAGCAGGELAKAGVVWGGGFLNKVNAPAKTSSKEAACGFLP